MVCGQCPPYITITSNTLAFGIYLPNTLDQNNQGQDPDNDWKTNFSIGSEKYGLFSVRGIEELTQYNFFSNIPTAIQNSIETLDLENEVDRATKIRNKLLNIQ
jgi:hypothetical protein